MPFAIDFDPITRVVSRLARDRTAVVDAHDIATPWTGISAEGADPGQHWLMDVGEEVDQAVGWLDRRIRAVCDVVDDVRAVDGQGERCARLRTRLHARVGPLSREGLDDLLAAHSRLHASEAAF